MKGTRIAVHHNSPSVYARGVVIFAISEPPSVKATSPKLSDRQADLEREVATIKASIGANAYEPAYNAGRGLTLDDVAAFASGGKTSIAVPLYILNYTFFFHSAKPPTNVCSG